MKTALLFLATQLFAQTNPPAANWPTYHGSFASWHYSELNQITAASVPKLTLKWVHQAQSLE